MKYKYLNYYDQTFNIVEGEPITIKEIPQIDFYITKKGSQWQVCIIETGDHFKPYRSKKKAINEAIDVILHWGINDFIRNMNKTKAVTKDFKTIQEAI